MVLGSVVFAAVIQHRHGIRALAARLEARDWAALAALGVVGHFVYQWLFMSGVARTSVANSSLIFGCTPVTVALLSSALGHERITPVRWAGVALSLEVEGGETRLPLEIEGALYRATEEALLAVSRSEDPRSLRVRFRRDAAAVRVEIAGGRPGPLNLAAMRERLRPFGGAVRVTSTPDAPTVIEVNATGWTW